MIKRIWACVLVTLPLCFITLNAVSQEVPPPSADDSLAVNIINTAVSAFKHTDTPVWAGYDLSTQTTLLYVPGHWAVLLNPTSPIAGYMAYPSHWPGIVVPALFHWGEIDELVGQLSFNYEVGAVKTVAVPVYTTVPDELGPVALAIFAFIVHEAFHQFQRSVFQDMESFSEEKYPILDVENNALIALEMHLLEDAIRQVEQGDVEAVRYLAEMFVAVRKERWDRTTPIVHAVERAKELQEGSAKYVEAQYVGIMADICRSGNISPGDVCEDFSSLTVTKYLVDDFDSRLRKGALSPEDVPRHRIYPMGASMCILLDFLDAPWKEAVEKGKANFTLAALLRESLNVSDSNTNGLVKEAKARYDFEKIVTASEKLVVDYTRGFEEALAAFEAQPGLRIAVEVPSSGLSRSRSSRGTRWTMDGGNKVLGEHYVVYTLKARDPDLFLKVENTAVLEELIEKTRKRVTFRVPLLTEAKVNGTSISLDVPGQHQFEDLILIGKGLQLTAKGQGTTVIGTDSVSVRVGVPSRTETEGAR